MGRHTQVYTAFDVWLVVVFLKKLFDNLCVIIANSRPTLKISRQRQDIVPMII